MIETLHPPAGIRPPHNRFRNPPRRGLPCQRGGKPGTLATFSHRWLGGELSFRPSRHGRGPGIARSSLAVELHHLGPPARPRDADRPHGHALAARLAGRAGVRRVQGRDRGRRGISVCWNSGWAGRLVRCWPARSARRMSRRCTKPWRRASASHRRAADPGLGIAATPIIPLFAKDLKGGRSTT